MIRSGNIHDRTDAAVARLLAELPTYRSWQHRPLTRSLKQILADLDEQALMSLAAAALVRLEEQRLRD